MGLVGVVKVVPFVVVVVVCLFLIALLIYCQRVGIERVSSFLPPCEMEIKLKSLALVASTVPDEPSF